MVSKLPPGDARGCSKCNGVRDRPGQRYCKRCAAAWIQVYRKKKRRLDLIYGGWVDLEDIGPGDLRLAYEFMNREARRLMRQLARLRVDGAGNVEIVK